MVLVLPSSSGLGHCPLKAEIAGSNPAGSANTIFLYKFPKKSCDTGGHCPLKAEIAGSNPAGSATLPFFMAKNHADVGNTYDEKAIRKKMF